MENIEAALSVGHCLVKPVTSGELKEMALISSWKADEFDVKLKNARAGKEKQDLVRAKAKAVAKLYFEHLSGMIIKHDFPVNGVELHTYLAGLSEDDINKIEAAGNEASSLSVGEQQDLSVPSEMVKPPNTTETGSSSSGTPSVKSLDSDGVRQRG